MLGEVLFSLLWIVQMLLTMLNLSFTAIGLLFSDVIIKDQSKEIAIRIFPYAVQKDPMHR